MIFEITDLDNEALLPYAHLTETQLRNRLEPEKGIFIAESPKVIRVALDAGYTPISLLCEQKHISGDASDIIARCPDIPVYTGPRSLLANLTGYELTRGVLGVMRRPTLPSVPQICSEKHRVAIIDNVVNATNTGAIFRAATALGIEAVLLTPTCCDPLNRRSVRVSMGTIFQIPWTYIPSWPCEGVSQLHDMGFHIVAMALRDNALSIDAPVLTAIDRMAILLGTEGDGLASEVIDLCDHVAMIPMHHNVDSLNVAAAASVAFWQLRRQ